MADSFENSWKRAFEKAEVNPPDSVWEGIDHAIANSEVVYYRKKALVYKWAAIIALLIAVTVSIPNFFKINAIVENELPVATKSISSESANSVLTNAISDRDAVVDGVRNQIPESRSMATMKEPLLILPEDESAVTRSSYAMLVHQKIGVVVGHLLTSEPQNIKIYKKANLLAARKSRKSNASGKSTYWAGVGVGSSGFNTGYQLNQPGDLMNTMLATQLPSTTSNARQTTPSTSFEEQVTEGTNYQVGINLGMMLGDRWYLESGFSYAESQLNSQTDVITENQFFSKSVAPPPNDLTSFGEATSNFVNEEITKYKREDIKMDNTFQFTSIPFKAGYVVLDRKVNLRLNAGFIANVYLGNTVNGDTDIFETFEMSPGATSPYRTLSFAGVTGMTIGYNLLDNVQLSIEPNFAQSLQPLTKNNSDFNAMPGGFGMMAGLSFRFQ